MRSHSPRTEDESFFFIQSSKNSSLAVNFNYGIVCSFSFYLLPTLFFFKNFKLPGFKEQHWNIFVCMHPMNCSPNFYTKFKNPRSTFFFYQVYIIILCRAMLFLDLDSNLSPRRKKSTKILKSHFYTARIFCFWPRQRGYYLLYLRPLQPAGF